MSCFSSFLMFSRNNNSSLLTSQIIISLTGAVISALRLSLREHSQVVICAAASCIASMDARHPTLTEEHVFNTLFAPLISCHTTTTIPPPTENAISQCINDLHRLFVTNAPPGRPASFTRLRPHVPVLAAMHAASARCRLHPRAQLEAILMTYFKTAEGEAAISDWVACVAETGVSFGPGEEGGVVMRPDLE
jgi:hypothetical protein